MLSTKEKFHISFYTFCLSIFGVMGITVIGPMVPAIAKDFNISIDAAWSIFTAFAIPGVFVALIVGVLADRFGRKAVIIPALACYIIGSVGCAVAPTFEVLLFWRAVQGLGSGPLGTLNSTIVADVFEPHERPRIMGYITVAITISSAFFPLLGGILAEWNWRLGFWLSLIGVPVLIGLLRLKLPYQGAAVSFKEYGKLCLKVIASHEALKLFFINFVMFFIFYGPVVTYFPIILEYFFQPSASLIGTIFLVGSLLSIFIAMQTGRVATHYSMRTILLIGFGLNFLALCSVFVLNSAWLYFIPVFLCSASQNLMMPVLSSRVSMLNEGQARGATMATNGLMFRLSQAVSPAACALMWMLVGPFGPFIMGAVGAAFLVLFTMLVMPKGMKVSDSIR